MGQELFSCGSSIGHTGLQPASGAFGTKGWMGARQNLDILSFLCMLEKKWTVLDVQPLGDFKKETRVTSKVLTPKVLTRGFCSSQTTIFIHLQF
jgi:hypothetical protein